MVYSLRYATRRLLGNPLPTTVVVLCLGLALGIGSSLFLFVDAILLRPLPVQAPEEFVWLSSKANFESFSYPTYIDLQEDNSVFAGLLAYAGIPLSLRGEGQPRVIYGQLVTANYFSLLGVQPVIGRGFLPEEDQGPGATPVAVLGYHIWQSTFGGRPDVEGETIYLNGAPYTVVGIAPKGFAGTRFMRDNHDIWVPMGMDPDLKAGPNRLTNRTIQWVEVMGRLHRGIDLQQAKAALEVSTQRLRSAYPEAHRQLRLNLFPAKAGHPSERDVIVPLALLLLGIATLVLVAACATVANLLLTQTQQRRGEIALRLALGGRRSAVITQLMVEYLLLFALAGVASLALAALSSRLMEQLAPALLDSGGLDFSLGPRFLFVTFGAALLFGLASSLAPAVLASDHQTMEAIKPGVGTAIKPRSLFGLQNLFIISQVVIAIILLVLSGLFMRSIKRAQGVDLGIANQDVLVFQLNFQVLSYNEETGRLFFREIMGRLERLPSVKSTSIALSLPLTGRRQRQGFYISGHEPPVGRDTFPIYFNVVAPGFFKTVGTPLLNGRDFSFQDGKDEPWLAIINQKMATQFWPGEDPVGKNFRSSDPEPEGRLLEIVGVVGDGRYLDAGEAYRPFVYLLLTQDLYGDVKLLIHGTGNPSQLIQDVRSEIQDIDPDLAPYHITSLGDFVGGAFLQQRLITVLIAISGLLAMMLAALGIYSMVAQTVTDRTREIGIRIALGATASQVVRLIVAQSTALVLAGAFIGSVAAYYSARILTANFTEFSAAVPSIYLGAVLFVLVVAVLASFLPARRAARLDPATALRAS